ncbi:MAG: hypothetical protein LBQ02_01055 [Candidatus Nomurabacteria bacterium]|nr:hypothetical protein [Candidatus Nomurabacteria bacterium]
MNKQIVIYQGKNGEIKFDAGYQGETIWVANQQIADLFGIDRTGVLRHIRNIYKTGELSEKATCAKIAQVQVEGSRKVERQIEVYNEKEAK